MASSIKTEYKLSKLNGRDYPYWKHLLKNLLESRGLYAIVFDNTLNPATDDEKEEWLAADAEAKEVILSFLDANHISMVKECQHSRDIMDKLDIAYNHKNLLERMSAEENFREYKMKSHDRIKDHLAKVEQLAQKVRKAGGEVSNVMLMAKILGSLSRKFHQVREAWLTPSKENDTLEDLKAGLLKEEEDILHNERLFRTYIGRKYGFHNKDTYTTHSHPRRRRRHSSERSQTLEDSFHSEYTDSDSSNDTDSDSSKDTDSDSDSDSSSQSEDTDHN